MLDRPGRAIHRRVLSRARHVRCGAIARAIAGALLALTVPALPAQPSDSASLAALTLMPMPASVRVEPGRLRLDSSFSVAAPRFRDGRLLRAIGRAVARLEARTGLDVRPGVGRDTTAVLIVDVHRAGDVVQLVNEDESYTLDVTPRRCVLRANTVVGALRGLETFLQLVTSDGAGPSLPLVHIEDRPRFPWRGLLIDVSRHWQPVEVIERNLDAMAMVKLNVLHWHLTDDQGFRVESRRFPKLHRLGSDGLYYTQDEVREVVAYARDRGIRVVPEFDMPGHATSWFVGYPQYASAPGPYAIARTFVGQDATFDPTREEVYHFLDRFIDEMTALFPDAYWHIGGDEVNGRQWDANPAIRRFMRAHHMAGHAALQAYFNRRLARILRAHGKRMVGWDEIMRPDLPRSTVVQSWRGQQSLSEGAREGFRGILSAGYYLDAMQTAAAHYTVDPLPLGDGLDATQAARVLGGEACMWGELVTAETIDSRIWPRTAAIAERFWSPATVTDIDDMYRRLAVVSVQLEEAGVTHLSQPGVMLRRLAPPDARAPLEALLELVEPARLGVRMRERRPSASTPLVTLADVAAPEAVGRRTVTRLVRGLLRDSTGTSVYCDSLARMFRSWRDLQPAIATLKTRVPLARDADSVAARLAALGAVGEEALGFLTGGVAPPPEWTATTLAMVDRAAAPAGLLRVGVASALRPLIIAASERTEVAGGGARD